MPTSSNPPSTFLKLSTTCDTATAVHVSKLRSHSKRVSAATAIAYHWIVQVYV